VTGALSLLTPCVFPMIPVTMAYFNRGESSARARAVRHALLFGGGIVATFTALGVGMAVLAGASGLARFAANPIVNVIIGAAFVAFALSLLGVYDLPLPRMSRLLGRADASARNRSGRAAGSVLMGFAFTLASFTCTAPFVGPLLVSAARGDWHLPLVGMLVFSTVFATPFFVLALVPRWTASLPRSGSWLNSVKFLVGLVELGAAVKFFSNADLVWGTGLISRTGMITFWIALAVVAVLYLVYPMLRVTPGRRSGLLRPVAAVAVAAVAIWLGSGLRGRSLGELEAFLPPDVGAASFASAEGPAAPLHREDTGPAWIVNDHRAALSHAQKTGRLVLIDFTGYTCTNCRWMEANMFRRPDVSEEMSRFVLSRLYTDGEGEIYENQQRFQEERFGTVALPLYAIVDGRGRTISTFSGLTRSPARFLAFLRSGSDG